LIAHAIGRELDFVKDAGIESDPEKRPARAKSTVRPGKCVRKFVLL
jgi:hypothetical protein